MPWNGLGFSREVCPSAAIIHRILWDYSWNSAIPTLNPSFFLALPVREPNQTGAGGELGHHRPDLSQIFRCHRPDQAAQGQLPAFRGMDLGRRLVHLPGKDVSGAFPLGMDVLGIPKSSGKIWDATTVPGLCPWM